MRNESTANKYDILFSSTIEFALRVGLYLKEDIVGANDEDIKLFCKKYQVNFPPAIWSCIRHFGKKAKSRHTGSSLGAHNLVDIEYALHQAGLRDEWHEGLNVKELLDKKNLLVNYDYDYPIDNEGLYSPPIKSLMNIDDIVIFNYDPFSRSFKFVDGSKENPEIFYLTRYYSLSSLFTSFSNRFRDTFFMYMANYAGDDFVEMAMIDGKLMPVGKPPIIDYSGGFEFVKKYQELFKKKNINRNKIKSLREQFYILNNKVEQSENRILSFNEFESNFLDFLEIHL